MRASHPIRRGELLNPSEEAHSSPSPSPPRLPFPTPSHPSRATTASRGERRAGRRGEAAREEMRGGAGLRQTVPADNNLLVITLYILVTVLLGLY